MSKLTPTRTRKLHDEQQILLEAINYWTMRITRAEHRLTEIEQELHTT